MLETVTVAELRDLAKQHGITGRWSMTKTQLIDVLKSHYCDDCEDQNQSDSSQKESTKKYVKQIKVGTIVAFKVGTKSGTVALSGKAVDVLANGKLVVETKQGTRFTLEASDILWVKTNQRWPRWVFGMFNQSEPKEV